MRASAHALGRRNVGDEAAPQSMNVLHRRMRETFGPVSVLVNNAEAYLAKPLLEYSMEDWDRGMGYLSNSLVGQPQFNES